MNFLRRFHAEDLTNYSPSYSGSYARLFALIIGIDIYEHSRMPNLSGAVADADSVFKFVNEKMSVSQERIQVIRNEAATRQSIIKNLSLLAEENIAWDIRKGDPILIFYAGHGAEAKWPERSSEGMIQMICPYDFNPQKNLDPDMQGIPDLTLAALLNEVSKEKGDNIVS